MTNNLFVRCEPRWIEQSAYKSRYVIYVTLSLMLTKVICTTNRPVRAYPFERGQAGVNSLLTKEQFNKVFEPALIELIGGKNGCPNGTKLLVAINSAARNPHRRQAIRQTWSRFVRASNQTLLFFVGDPGDVKLRRQLKLENRKYRDIVLLPVRESYYLLTYKMLAVFNWANVNCPAVSLKFLMKCDDDFYVDWPNLFAFFTDKESSDVFYGEPNPYTQVHRNNRSRWYMPVEAFPDRNYPSFLRGSPYVLGASLLPKLLKAAGQTKLLYLEDVTITGILREQITGARMETIPNLFATYSPDDEPCLRALALHKVKPHQMQRLFESQLSGRTNSSRCLRSLSFEATGLSSTRGFLSDSLEFIS